MKRMSNRQERIALFRARGAHRLILETLLHLDSATVPRLQEVCELSRRFTQAIVQRGLTAGVIRIEKPGVYSISRAGMDFLAKHGGLMFEIPEIPEEVLRC